MPRKLVLITAALLLPAAALAAPHGRPGLWSITSRMEMPNMPKMPPEVAAMMKQAKQSNRRRMWFRQPMQKNVELFLLR